MKRVIRTAAAAVFGFFAGVPSGAADTSVQSVLDLSAEEINGTEVVLSQYRGRVVMIVNTASKCGFTPQYEGLQTIYERYVDEGFVVLGFPSDNFAGQEFDTEAEIAEFCELNFGVTFPMFAKVDVRGGNQHPVYAYLTDRETAGEFSGRISWNFNKFLIGRDGRIIARFGSRVRPADPKVIAAIEEALAAMPPGSAGTAE